MLPEGKRKEDEERWNRAWQRKEVGDNVWRWGGQKEYEIDAKSLHWHGILTRKSTIKAYPYNTPQPSPCKQHQRKRKETWRAHIYIVVMSWSHTFVMCGVLPPFILITGRFRILLGSILKVLLILSVTIENKPTNFIMNIAECFHCIRYISQRTNILCRCIGCDFYKAEEIIWTMCIKYAWMLDRTSKTILLLKRVYIFSLMFHKRKLVKKNVFVFVEV